MEPMETENRLTSALIILAFSAFLVGIGFMTLHYSGFPTASKLESHGQASPGRVLSTWQEETSSRATSASDTIHSTSYYARIAFPVGDETLQQDFFVSKNAYHELGIGAHTTVLFLPEDPEVARPINDMGRSWLGLSFTVFTFLVSLLGPYALLRDLVDAIRRRFGSKRTLP